MLSDEQLELKSAVTRCLERSVGPRPFLAGEPTTETAWDPELWRVLGTEVGIAGLVVPEELGGSGARYAELAVVAEALGTGPAAVPFLGTVALATSALLVHRDDPVSRELLSRIAEGGTTATLACTDNADTCDFQAACSGAGVTAAEAEGEWRLTGRVGFVVDTTTADELLVAARTPAGVALLVVAGVAAGVERVQSASLDLTRPLGVLTLDGALGRLIGPPEGADERISSALDLALVVLAAEQVGGMQACLDGAVEYAKQRVQFDRPIGSFQAIKHQLVDVLLEVEMARSAAETATAAADAFLLEPGPETARALTVAASLAKSVCSEAFMRTAEATLHVYGGTGFTWEHDAHLHWRRAKASELFLGTPVTHRERLAVGAGL
ncbi:acyl-CoA dehydrogenase family protein [Pseudonocardia sp. RS010]|uniref:acyl-CoA dehydrogenase family protein n=1 Tax=Pseudonocardia sp. RS010 TaxID=3385979 RepID=UPI0039A091B6